LAAEAPHHWTQFWASAKLFVVAATLSTKQSSQEHDHAAPQSDSLNSRLKLLNWSGILFAVLQSACTAVIAISGIRVAIGLSALAAAAGIHAPARGFHQDAIRIPTMLLALAGSLVNLFVIWKVRKLRSKPASQWRQKPVTSGKLNSERFQIALSILTLLLLAAEWLTHPMIHRVP
jgi:ABC-type xylose transport system permease subunit